MRRIVCGVVVALGLSVAIAAPAAAYSGTPVSSNWVPPVVTPYTTSYVDFGGTTLACVGAFVVKSGDDTETQVCHVTPGPEATISPGRFSGSPTGLWPYGVTAGYNSDYYLKSGVALPAASWSIRSFSNGDGTFTWVMRSTYSQ